MTPLSFIARLRSSVLHDEGGDRGPAPAGYSAFWEADDATCLWKNLELIDALNDARTEYFRRVGVVETVDIPLLITAGVGFYEIDEPYLSIERVLNSSGIPLFKTSHELADWSGRSAPDQCACNGPASAYYEDADHQSIRIVSPPVNDDELTITIRRLPWRRVYWEGRNIFDCEIPEHHYPGLLHFAAHIAYGKRDTDTEALSRAKYHEAQFSMRVGPAVSAEAERITRRMANRYSRAEAQFL